MLALSGTMVVAPPVSAAPGECPPGWAPVGPGTGGDFFDQNVSVFAGGDFTAGETAAESEGVLVALGNASFQRTLAGRYNVGVVGVGSGVTPSPGTDMLVVGGNMSGNSLTTVDVGFGIGGNVVVGGSIAPGTTIQTSGGSQRSGLGAAATAPYSGLPALIQSKSAEIAALPNTGTVDIDPLGVPSMRFVGDRVSDPQVFTIPGTPAHPTARSRSRAFPTGAAVYINVASSTPDLNISDLTGGSDFTEVATHTLWNFPAATSVTLRGGAQFPGSILVPNPSSTVTNSMPGTNGRIYVNGNLVHIGQGSEMHNYPFLPDSELDCFAILGGFTVHKVVVDPDNVADPNQSFSGTYSCTHDGAPVGNGTWSTTIGAQPTQVADQLPVGAVCSIAESPPSVTPPGHVWQPAQITPSSVTIPDNGVLVGFTVTNTLAPVATTGGFTVAKTVVDPDGVVSPATVYSGTYSCTSGGADVTPSPNTWSTTAGAAPVVVTSALPLGRCARWSRPRRRHRMATTPGSRRRSRRRR